MHFGHKIVGSEDKLIKYIFGRPGTGKTARCIEEILGYVNSGMEQVFYIVPEQFSLQSEKDVLEKSGKSSVMNLQVLSFQRLAYLVFSKQGKKKKILDDTGKSILLKKALMNVSEDLKVYKSAGNKNGFIDSLINQITEFYQYGMDPDFILKRLSVDENSEKNENLKLKLLDLSLIFNEYIRIKEENYITGDESLDALAERIPQCAFLHGAKIWFDGFNGFTPQEFKVIEKLMPIADLTFSFTTPPEGFRAKAPFYKIREAIKKVYDMAQNAGVQVCDNMFMTENLKHASFKALKFLEENYFQFETSYGEIFDGENGIRFIEGEDPNSEVLAVAAEIIRLTREENFRYNEIGVLTSALSSYHKIYKSVFTQYEIPIFIDKTEDISAHPLPVFLLSAFEIVVTNWSYESVFGFLKTGMTGIEQNQIDLIENYVLAFGIRGGKWKKEFSSGFSDSEYKYESFDCNSVNLVREKIVNLISPLDNGVKRNTVIKISDFCKRAYEFLEASGALNVLGQWIVNAGEKGDAAAYRINSQIYKKVIHVLEKLVEMMGEQEITIGEFLKLLEAGFLSTKMGIIPPSLDQVIVGDLRRSRLPKVRALIISGANDGLLPMEISESGLFSHRDRNVIENAGITLSPDGEKKAEEDKLDIYLSLTKPSEYLYLSYHLRGFSGEERTQSETILRLKSMLNQIKIIKNGSLDHTAAFNKKLAFNRLISALAGGEISDYAADLYGFFKSDRAFSNKLEIFETTLKNAGNDRAYLSEQSKNLLYGKRILTSVSRLEKYAGCPFSYFAGYNLKAVERKLYSLQRVDLGNIFHEIFLEYANAVKAENVLFRDIDDKKCEDLAGLAIERACSRFEIFKYSNRYKNYEKRVSEISKKSLWALTNHLKSGDFEIFGAEVQFSENEGFPCVEIPLDDGAVMLIRGKIDRVDTLSEKDEVFIKVVDYKSGKKKFSFEEVYFGLSFQLIIYMEAFIRQFNLNNLVDKRAVPGAALYFNISDPFLNYSEEQENSADVINRNVLKAFKMTGVALKDAEIAKRLDNSLENGGMSDIFPLGIKKSGNEEEEQFYSTSVALNKEDFQKLNSFSVKKAAEIGNRILSGDIGINPYKMGAQTPCSFCPYGSICGFDPVFDSAKQRILEIGAKEALEKILDDLKI